VARGIACSPDEVFVTAGFTGALDLITRALLRDGGQAWCEDPGYPHAREGLRLAGAISPYWDMRGLIRTGRQWLESLLEAEATVPAGMEPVAERRAWRARGLIGAATLAWLGGEGEAAERYVDQGYALWHELGEARGLAQAATLQLHAVATLKDGTKTDVTPLAIWSSDNPGVARTSIGAALAILDSGEEVLPVTYAELVARIRSRIDN